MTQTRCMVYFLKTCQIAKMSIPLPNSLAICDYYDTAYNWCEWFFVVHSGDYEMIF